MTKIKYYFKRLFALDYKNMWRLAGEISKEHKRSRLYILIDMVICSLRYQAGYMEYFEYEFFLLNHKQRQTFMTTGKAHQIIMKYNQRDQRYKFADKTVFNEIFKDFIGRDYIDVRESTVEELQAFMEKYQVVMAKRNDAMMGDGVERVDVKDIKDFSAFHAKLLEQRQFLIEEFFVQHEDMSKLYPDSVNTLRVITFFDGKDVHVLESILKIGNGGHLDNFGAGGMYTILDENGVVKYPAFDMLAKAYTNHPITGTPIVGFQVPNFDILLETMDRAARVVPEIQYVGWDVAIGQVKPALIEGNYNTGVFQMKPSLTGEKIGLVPRYRSIIDF
ncbi:MAG: hexapeptide transferase [Erysipelothrix sp.]|nr:hexapeptide transferase [Erysipelothrix sp.]